MHLIAFSSNINCPWLKKVNTTSKLNFQKNQCSTKWKGFFRCAQSTLLSNQLDTLLSNQLKQRQLLNGRRGKEKVKNRWSNPKARLHWGRAWSSQTQPFILLRPGVAVPSEARRGITGCNEANKGLRLACPPCRRAFSHLHNTVVTYKPSISHAQCGN